MVDVMFQIAYKFRLFSFSLLTTTTFDHVMDFSADDVAKVVLEEFDRLPTKRKPLVRGDGVREWVPLSGIVAQGFTPEKAGADHEADVFHRER
jgi:hypothetical protein